MKSDDVVVGICGDNSKTDVFLGTTEGGVLAAVRGEARAALVPSRIRVVGGRSFLNIPGH